LYNVKETAVKTRGSQRDIIYLTNSALAYEPKCGVGRVAVCGVSADEYSCAQINFGDLTLYFIYGCNCLCLQDFSGRIFEDDNNFFTAFALCHLFGRF
jgi:hypothetical protein